MTMTIDDMLTLARLKELQALERLRRALVLDARDPDWTYCLAAMDERLFRLRALLSRVDSGVLATAEEMLHAEQLESARPAPLVAVNVPPSSRIH